MKTTIHNGSCRFTNSTADNYSAQGDTGNPAVECEYIGCTNKKAVNSNEGANTDDGSRQFKVTFRVDMWTTNCATRISADLTSDAGLSMEWANDSLYKYTAALHAGMHTFHYRMEDGTAEGLSHEISLDTSLLLNVVFFNSWEARTG